MYFTTTMSNFHSSFFILHSSFMIYLSLGTNLGNKEENLRLAISEIQKRIGTVVSQSAFIATEPWGFESENSFLNACIGIETNLLPFELLDATQAIERDLGRKEKSKNEVYHDRIIDIDILIYHHAVIRTQRLTIPHAHLSERMFVLEPLDEIAHNLIVPGTTMSVGEMRKALAAC